MFLKTLTLKGFKSFAEPTTIELEPGITVVVGPNGSGKSNVVDAVAWVLGAQGPRSMRSGKMEDVIFAGSARRPALGRAEVSLTIDNSAGKLPIGLAEVTITRTLWRSGESEYAINGAPCRLLDVQELLSDSGMGRQQHMIVGQGQLDQVLNARPEDRRLIVEEAAGVLKYRRRRERAERRLESTEADLARLEDILGELRRQLRPLQRQADAARRHGALAAEHRAIRLHLAGREIAALEDAAGQARRDQEQLQARVESLQGHLGRLRRSREAAEEEIARLRAKDAAAEAGRLEALAERARGMTALIAQRRRSVAASIAQDPGEGAVSLLGAEMERTSAELASAEEAVRALEPEAAELALREAVLAEARAAAFAAAAPTGRLGLVLEDAAEPSHRVAETRGRIAALSRAAERYRAEAAAALGEADVLAAQVPTLAAAEEDIAAGLRQARDVVQRASGELELAKGRAEAARAEAALAAEEAAATASEHRASAARVEALEMAVAEVRARGAAGRLAGEPGVLGALVELVEVDCGWEAAFGAAVGEALAAVVVASTPDAAGALEALNASGTAGAVLAAHGPAGSGQGPLPGRPLRRLVRGLSPEVDAVLDVLCARAVVVDGDWRQALDVYLANPSLVVVTAAGDRFASDGWRIASPGPGATGAALAEAVRAKGGAEHAARAAAEKLAEARARLARAGEAEAGATVALEQASAAEAGAADALARARARRASVEDRRDRLASRAAELIGRAQRDEDEAAELSGSLPALEADATRAAEVQAAARAKLREVEEIERSLSAERRELEVRAAEAAERRRVLAKRRDELESRLRDARRALEVAAGKRSGLHATEVVLARLASSVESCAGRLRSEQERIATLRSAWQAALDEQSAALARMRQEQTMLEVELDKAAGRGQQAELRTAELRLRQEAAAEALERELGVSPAEAVGAPCPDLPSGVSARERELALERELRLMGPVNPLAVAELEECQERTRFMEAQLEDVQAARRELRKVISAIDAEIEGVFAAAYAEVSRHFTDLFATLFPGGSGRLSLTDPANLLETGIEVDARPAGKNLRRLSLLSGGERSLVALAFLCAVFRSRPSPFYLMDEVEAALDDVNLHRFLDLVNDFREDAQLMIVSHQKRTMEIADCLYGVSMQPGGSSRVVSERASRSRPVESMGAREPEPAGKTSPP